MDHDGHEEGSTKTAAVAGVLLPHMRRRVMASVEPHLPVGEPNMARAALHRGHTIGPSEVTSDASQKDRQGSTAPDEIGQLIPAGPIDQ